MLLFFLLMAGVILADQLTKILALQYLAPVGSYPLWEDVLHLTYVENTGAAFGMMKDSRWIFMVTSTVAIVGILVYMVYRTYIKKNPLPWMEALSLSLIVGGGIGNMIDRTVLGYVVDMIDFRLINFAVFNVADSFVCVGAGLMVLYLIREMVKETKAEKAKKGVTAEESEDELTEETPEETPEETLEESAHE